MRFKTNVRIFRGRIDMAPLIDVMFILVVFFLISTSYDFQPGHKVNLPVSKAPLVAGHKLVVVITTKSEEEKTNDENIVYFFNNEEVSVEELDVKLNERINKRSISAPGNKTRYPTISLKVDQNVPHKYVQKVFQIAYERRVQVNQVVSVPE